MVTENALFIYNYLTQKMEFQESFDSVILFSCFDIPFFDSILEQFSFQNVIIPNEYSHVLSDLNEKNVIFFEQQTKDRYECLLYLKPILEELGITKLLVVCKSYQQMHYIELFKKIIPSVEIQVRRESFDFKELIHFHQEKKLLTSAQIIQELVDEVSNLINGPACGFLYENYIPFEVIDCYNFLLMKDFKNKNSKRAVDELLEKWDNLGIKEELVIEKKFKKNEKNRL